VVETRSGARQRISIKSTPEAVALTRRKEERPGRTNYVAGRSFATEVERRINNGDHRLKRKEVGGRPPAVGQDKKEGGGESRGPQARATPFIRFGV